MFVVLKKINQLFVSEPTYLAQMFPSYLRVTIRTDEFTQFVKSLLR